VWDRGPEGSVLEVLVVDAFGDGVLEGGEDGGGFVRGWFVILGSHLVGCWDSRSFGLEMKSNGYLEIGAELCFDGML
jgi:hypothetical protein